MVRGAGADTVGIGDEQRVAANASPLTPPTTMSLEFVFWLVNVG